MEMKNVPNFREIEIGFKSLNFKTFNRFVDKHPFVPSNPKEIEERCEEIFTIQSSALAKRFEHTKSKKANVFLRFLRFFSINVFFVQKKMLLEVFGAERQASLPQRPTLNR